jgi:hypothetical protein
MQRKDIELAEFTVLTSTMLAGQSLGAASSYTQQVRL